MNDLIPEGLQKRYEAWVRTFPTSVAERFKRAGSPDSFMLRALAMSTIRAFHALVDGTPEGDRLARHWRAAAVLDPHPDLAADWPRESGLQGYIEAWLRSAGYPLPERMAYDLVGGNGIVVGALPIPLFDEIQRAYGLDNPTLNFSLLSGADPVFGELTSPGPRMGGGDGDE